MDFSTILALMAIMMVGMAWYANSSKRDKIYCSFRRINKTKVVKFVKMRSRYVIFDGARYDIVPSCITFEWFDKGLIGQMFPQYVATLDFCHYSRFPLDPNTLKPVVISPEVRQAMNKEEWVKSYAKGFVPPTTKKQSLIQQYLPFASIVLVILVGFYLYMNMQILSQQYADLANALRAITK